MTAEEFERMTDEAKRKCVKKYSDRCVRLLWYGYAVHELDAWEDEEFWRAWQMLGLETDYQIAMELRRMMDDPKRLIPDDWIM